MEDSEKFMRFERTWRGVLTSWVLGAAGVAALVLLCLAPEDDAPLGWAFWATKVGGLALLVAVSKIYDAILRRVEADGGDGDEE